jgi:hypothetical protein
MRLYLPTISNDLMLSLRNMHRALALHDFFDLPKEAAIPYYGTTAPTGWKTANLSSPGAGYIYITKGDSA